MSFSSIEIPLWGAFIDKPSTIPPQSESSAVDEITEASSAVIRSRPQPEFAYFSYLPYELRLMIWNFAIRVPRIVSVQSQLLTKRREPTPPVLAVCQESRAEGLKHYERVPIRRKAYPGDSDRSVRIPNEFVGYSYINFELDVIHFSQTTWADYPEELRRPPPHLCGALDHKYHERVRRIALTNQVQAPLTLFTDTLMVFKNLEEFDIVYDDTRCNLSVFTKTSAYIYTEIHVFAQMRHWQHIKLFEENKHKLKDISRRDLFADLSIPNYYLPIP